MSHRPARLRSLRLLALALIAVSLLACGGSDDGDDGAGDADRSPATAAASADGTRAPDGGTDAPDEPVPNPYENHDPSAVYAQDDHWICRPDLADDECRDLDVTTIGPDGSRTVEEREADLDAPVDCFYVYPTVSSDPGTNSDLVVAPGDPEALTVAAQAAQYARSCRVYAPVYRQVTLAGLGSGGFGRGGDIAYADVVDAWRTYISKYNDGRGVILIGHSQGTGHLVKLIAEEIDDEPVLRDRLVAAHLFGGSVQAPEGELVGGTFDNVPGCSAPDEIGCVVTWSSYPATDPPEPGAIFGGAGEDGQRSLCVDAVGLLGRDHASPVAPTEAPLVGGIEGVEGIETRFVALPDAVDVACAATGAYDYLGVSLVDVADPRPLGQLVNERLGPTWGLHLVDMTVALDDLVELAAQQGAAYAGQ